MRYNRRKWLNRNSSSSTASVVCHSGPANWLKEDGSRDFSRFIEISDCHNKVRLHQAPFETADAFIGKISLLRSELLLFMEYLEKEKGRS